MCNRNCYLENGAAGDVAANFDTCRFYDPLRTPPRHGAGFLFLILPLLFESCLAQSANGSLSACFVLKMSGLSACAIDENGVSFE